MPAYKMDYDKEADYIEAVDFKNPGKSFSYDPYVFIKYCDMQYRIALKSDAINAANRIAIVRNAAFSVFQISKK